MAGASLQSLPAGAIEEARSTLGGAVSVAQHLPAHLAADMLALARAAFTHALELTAVASVAIVIFTAVFVAARLRGGRPSRPSSPVLV
jgi:DHA2 family multidrug resistance protein-like MFS transporter